MQAAAARVERVLLGNRYRFYQLGPSFIWNNGQPFDQNRPTIDFLSRIVIATDSPSLLLFARSDQFGPDTPPIFDISIDGGRSRKIAWGNVLMPLRLRLGEGGEHTVIILANPLCFNRINVPFPLLQNVITGFAVPARYHLQNKVASLNRMSLVTLTDSIGQGFLTADPPLDAWTARLANSGAWPGAVMNRGFAGARLVDFCSDASACDAYAAVLHRDYPKAAAYYIALGTNDYAIVGKARCIHPYEFGSLMFALLKGIHNRSPQASVYLQTPIHRTDESRPNACGNTLVQYSDAEIQMAENLSWIKQINGFAVPFPQLGAASNSTFVDGVHPTASGQEQYFQAVLQGMRLKR